MFLSGTESKREDVEYADMSGDETHRTRDEWKSFHLGACLKFFFISFSIIMASDLSSNDAGDQYSVSTLSPIKSSSSNAPSIRVSSTMRYHSAQNSITSISHVNAAFCLKLNPIYERRLLILLAEPEHSIRDDRNLFHGAGRLGKSFQVGSVCGVWRDAVLLDCGDGWKLVVPDQWYGELSLRWKLHRFLFHFFLHSNADFEMV